jgi:aspartate aminotransferase-like enzyme
MDDGGIGRFFLPGPTAVHPEVLRAQVGGMIPHRGPAMRALWAAVQPTLRAVFGTARPVYVAASSATGLMEAGVRNGVRRRALCLVHGAFGARFADIVRACGRAADVLEGPPGSAPDPETVGRRLRAGDHDAVTIVHVETSTGAMAPLGDLVAAVHEAERATGREILLLVDAVTSAGAVPLEVDAWALDWTLTGSQKALALPPGLAFAVASPRLLARAAEQPDRGRYFDALEFERFADQGETPNTPALTLLYALAVQARRLEVEGLPARFARHRAMAERVWAWAEARGVPLLAAPAARAPTVSALEVPHAPRVVAALAERGFVVGTGYGPLRDRFLRIGHMGEHGPDHIDRLLDELDTLWQSLSGAFS